MERTSTKKTCEWYLSTSLYPTDGEAACGMRSNPTQKAGSVKRPESKESVEGGGIGGKALRSERTTGCPPREVPLRHIQRGGTGGRLCPPKEIETAQMK